MKHLLFVALAAATFAGWASCPARCDGLARSGTHFAEDALRPFVEKGELPGAISVFFKEGKHEVACVGYANAEMKRPIALDNAYMQCSQTKGFCGVTIAILVEEGKISLEDPVSKYLPEFQTLWIETSKTNDTRVLVKAKNVLTIRHVMNHTGGFPFELANGQAMGGWSRRMPLRSVAATAAAQPIMFEPGSKASYSNVGIDIGAAIVEVVTGMRWEQFLQARVLDPLGMTSTGFWPTDEQLATKIEMYEVKPGAVAQWQSEAPWMQRPYGDDRVFASAGAGLWTTVADQLKFYKMLMNLGVGENGVRILKAETVRAILATDLRPQGCNDGGYSLGLSVRGDGWFGHGGAWGTHCVVNPDKRQLKLWVVQLRGGPRPWDQARAQAAEKFFDAQFEATDAYTGRLK